jgi:cyclopropane-fatty-acyl-phospholipid synthase
MMTSHAAPIPASAASAASAATLAGAPAAGRSVLQLMSELPYGSLDLELPGGELLRFGGRAQPGLRASIRLANWNVCPVTLASGDIGFAESFIAGDWSSPDLPALLRLFIANRQAVEGLVYGRWWGRLLHRAHHLLNRNSRAGSRRNVHAHYDLGNAFYQLWLDAGMSYSSAWFDGDTGQPLEQAQQAKWARALAECRLPRGGRLLELGCGWGAMAECAAAQLDAHVTGVTLSTEQLAYARQRLHDAGFAGQADLRLQDYRDVNDGPYDAVVSIEMFEAVGQAYWPQFFSVLQRQLKAGGHACIQTITIRDDLFPRYVRGTDFIQQYIFPGGLLPSRAAFRAQAAKAGLEVVNELAFGGDYAETLRRWRQRFAARQAAVRDLGFDTRFLRIWSFYLAYCEAAFDAGNTDVVQFTLRKPA